MLLKDENLNCPPLSATQPTKKPWAQNKLRKKFAAQVGVGGGGYNFLVWFPTAKFKGDLQSVSRMCETNVYICINKQI